MLAYAINGNSVTPPAEEVWSNIVAGESLAGQQKRSPYRRLEWSLPVADACHLEWWDYDNTVLTSLTTRPPNMLDDSETYTDVICQSVTMRQRRGMGSEVTITFLVRVD